MTTSLADKPAFPRSDSNELSHHEPGMTLREHYAGLAIQGILANTQLAGAQVSTMASDAVIVADALIAELEKS